MTLSLLGACGGGSSSSGVPADAAVLSLPYTSRALICLAQIDYLFKAIGSVQNWCWWIAEIEATGTTDAELQSSCAVQEGLCLANPQAKIEALKATMCITADPLASAPFMAQYMFCNTTAGQLEECGREQVDIAASLRNAPCSEYSMARRDAANMPYATAQSCVAIQPSCP